MFSVNRVTRWWRQNMHALKKSGDYVAVFGLFAMAYAMFVIS